MLKIGATLLCELHHPLQVWCRKERRTDDEKKMQHTPMGGVGLMQSELTDAEKTGAGCDGEVRSEWEEEHMQESSRSERPHRARDEMAIDLRR